MNKKSYSFCSAKQFFDYSLAGRECGLLSAKGGLMMGTKKVGILSSPRKRTIFIIQKK